MKKVEGLSMIDGELYYDHQGQKINLTAISDTCGALHMRKAMKMLMDQTGIDAKQANTIIYQAYLQTPPNREKVAKHAERAAELRTEIDEYKRASEHNEAEKAMEPIRCPKCGSTSLSDNKKGFGIGKAVVGAAVAGPVGLIAGNIGAKKVRITCLKCGHQFWAGKS